MLLPISNLHQLAGLIRSELAAARKGAPVARNRVRAGDAPVRAGARYTSAALPGLISARVARLEAGDPQRRRKATRIFIEAVLLAEFGEHLVAEAGFHDLIEQIQTAIEQQADGRALLEEAGRQLLGESA